jgi:K+-sensing histidine kinase KdpD
LAQVQRDDDLKKLQPLTIPKIVEQLERALMDIKYHHSENNDEYTNFNKIENVPINSSEQLPTQFIGKELMLFEMVGIINGKITELEKKFDDLKKNLIQDKNSIQSSLQASLVQKTEEFSEINFNEREVSVNEIISDVINNEQKDGSQVPILLGLDHDILIHADKILLSKVIHAILKNAIQNTESGHIKVESFVAHEQNVFILRIYDTGKGISEELLPTLFDEKDSQHNYQVVSDKEILNLHHCKKIVEIHGGKISAKNNENGGAVVTISIPIKKND